MARKTPTPADVVVPVRLTAIQARCLDHVLEHRGAEIASVTGREPTRSGAVRLILRDYFLSNPITAEVDPDEIDRELQEWFEDGNPFLE